MSDYTILSTKKLAPSLHTEAKQHGIHLIEQEFISIQPILTKEKWDELSKWIEYPIEYAAFTSAQAVLPFKKYLHPYVSYQSVEWKVFCLSGKTKEAVLDTSLPWTILETANNAKELAQKIIQHQVKDLLFLCGDKRRDELPQILISHGIAVHELVLYETRETTVALEHQPDGVLFFSPSAVHSFFSANQLNPHTVCFAIGTTTADALAAQTANTVIISESPRQESILDAVYQYYQNFKKHE